MRILCTTMRHLDLDDISTPIGELAYAGRPGAPQGMLVFDIELLQIVSKGPEPIPAPDDVAEAPANAEKTESGLASRVIKAGEGKAHPGPRDVVSMHFTAWKTSGEPKPRAKPRFNVGLRSRMRATRSSLRMRWPTSRCCPTSASSPALDGLGPCVAATSI